MRLLRDFYLSLDRCDRAVVWIGLGLALAIGLIVTAVTNHPQKTDAMRFTAPPAWLQFAAVSTRGSA